jgi:hypothetical protein
MIIDDIEAVLSKNGKKGLEKSRKNTLSRGILLDVFFCQTG